MKKLENVKMYDEKVVNWFKELYDSSTVKDFDEKLRGFKNFLFKDMDNLKRVILSNHDLLLSKEISGVNYDFLYCRKCKAFSTLVSENEDKSCPVCKKSRLNDRVVINKDNIHNSIILPITPEAVVFISYSLDTSQVYKSLGDDVDKNLEVVEDLDRYMFIFRSINVIAQKKSLSFRCYDTNNKRSTIYSKKIVDLITAYTVINDYFNAFHDFEDGLLSVVRSNGYDGKNIVHTGDLLRVYFNSLRSKTKLSINDNVSEVDRLDVAKYLKLGFIGDISDEAAKRLKIAAYGEKYNVDDNSFILDLDMKDDKLYINLYRFSKIDSYKLKVVKLDLGKKIKSSNQLSKLYITKDLDMINKLLEGSSYEYMCLDTLLTAIIPGLKEDKAEHEAICNLVFLEKLSFLYHYLKNYKPEYELIIKYPFFTDVVKNSLILGKEGLSVLDSLIYERGSSIKTILGLKDQYYDVFYKFMQLRIEDLNRIPNFGVDDIKSFIDEIKYYQELLENRGIKFSHKYYGLLVNYHLLHPNAGYMGDNYDDLSVLRFLSPFMLVNTITKITNLDAYRIYSYISNVYENQKIEMLEAMILWKDYLEMVIDLESLKVNLDNKTTLMPLKLKESHDKIAELHRELLREGSVINDRFKERAMDMKDLEFSNEEYSIVVPEEVGELINEGESLNHCSSNYIKPVAMGNTQVVFLRKNDNLNKSYVTIEIRKNHIVQVKAFSNKEVEDKKALKFIEDWKKVKGLV